MTRTKGNEMRKKQNTSLLPSPDSHESETSNPLTNSKTEKPKMSANEVVAAAAETIKKSFKFFNLSNLKLEAKDIEVTFTPATEIPVAVERLGNDSKLVLSILNDALREKTVQDAKKNAAPEGVASKKTVLDFIKSFRMSPTFATIVTTEKGDAGWKDQYNKQTDAILSQILQVPFMMDQLKAIAANAPLDEKEEADETETK